jgi:hypothetical protein
MIKIIVKHNTLTYTGQWFFLLNHIYCMLVIIKIEGNANDKNAQDGMI